MTLPFTTIEFLAVFAAYNAAIWPFQIAAYGLGLVVLSAVFVPSRGLMRIGLAALAILWAITGIGYHLIFFAKINPVAPAFAALFVVQAILFVASAFRPADLRLHLGWDFRTVAGLVTIVYGVAIYPVLGIWAGHGLMAGPMFGVAPCPTTIFTIGLLLLSRGRWVVWLSVIPFLWSLIGLAAALQLGIPEDLGMPVAGVALAGVLGWEAWLGRPLPAVIAKDAV
jgi:Family of unknown function (DUF6064)